MTYQHHYQRCATHGREFCPDAGCRTQRTRAASGPAANDSSPTLDRKTPPTSTPMGAKTP